MPTLHRLATLRDDVIFFVYLYQAYYYKIDPKRVNEFGQGGEDDEVVEAHGGEKEVFAEEERKTIEAAEAKEEGDKPVEVEKASGVEVEGTEGLRRRAD